jgi:hypothetical protein
LGAGIREAIENYKLQTANFKLSSRRTVLEREPSAVLRTTPLQFEVLNLQFSI